MSSTNGTVETHNPTSDVKLEKDGGIDPVNWLSFKDKTIKFVKCPIDEGIAPASRLRSKYLWGGKHEAGEHIIPSHKTVSESKSPIVDGIDPVRPMPCKLL